jgi:3-oxoacyl-[acyl-carrier-protein] synthase II
MASHRREVVITGVGVVSPIGIGRQAYQSALAAGRSGVRRITLFDPSELTVDFAGEIEDFDPKAYVRPRKSLKVMSREIQFGFAAADQALADAGLAGDGEPNIAGTVDPDRFGVVFGADMMYCEPEELIAAYRACTHDGRCDFTRWGTHAMSEMYPLWMLKYLPNMAACHIGIALDARGPNNTITLGDVSSLVAIAEAADVIERGWADVMIAGGTSGRVNAGLWPFRNPALLSHRRDDPPAACRPFETSRDGMVIGEGAAALVLEDRSHAESRGAKIQAAILGWGNTFHAPGTANNAPGGLAGAIGLALARSDLSVADIGHVNANGLSTPLHDRLEAEAIHSALGDTPVTALKSYFGNLGAASKAVELVASLTTLESGWIPATRNIDSIDPACPINLVHGQPRAAARQSALLVSQAIQGQSMAMVLAKC